MPFKEPLPQQRLLLTHLRPFLRQSGDDHREPWYMGERKLLDYLLVYIASGQGIFSLEDQCFAVKEGDLFWMPPDIVHSMRGTSRIMHCLYLHFDLEYDPARSHWNAVIPAGITDLSPWLNRMHPPCPDEQINSWHGPIDYHGSKRQLHELIASICREHRRGEGHPLRLSGMLLELLDLLLQHTAAPGRENHHDRLMDEAAACIRMESEHIVTVSELSSRFGLSDSHFRRLFRDRHGQTPAAMLQQSRIRAACELLAYSNCNISEIAARTGFNSIYNFSRVFKREMGISPRDYRR